MKKCLFLATLVTLASATAAQASHWKVENGDQTIQVSTNGQLIKTARLKFILTTSDCSTATIRFAGIAKNLQSFEKTDHTVWVNDTYPVTVKLLSSEYRNDHRAVGLFDVGSYLIDGLYLEQEFDKITLSTPKLQPNSWSGAGLRQALKDAQSRCMAIS